MALHPGNIQRHNNEIQIAVSDTAIGHNPWIYEAEPIASKGDKAFQGKIASTAGTIHKGPQPSQNKTSPEGHDRTSAEKWQSATAHEEEKTALLAVGVAGGLAALWLSSLEGGGEDRAELGAGVDQPLAGWGPRSICCWPSQGGSSVLVLLVILDVARCYLCIFTLYINIKIGKISC